MTGAEGAEPSPEPAAELMVYAAASLQESLEELRPAWERGTGAPIVLNTGASSTLAQQILAARRADLFVSADEGWMDRLAGAGLVDETSRRSFLSNRLVVVAPAASPRPIASARDLAGPAIARLSLADPELVPAGIYARKWLESAGVWDAVRDRVVPGVDVRAALAAVESGAIPAGVVYRTDAAVSRRVRVVFEVPEGEAPPISYAVAAMKGPRLASARRAAAWLGGAEARAVFARRGFVLPGGGAR